LNLIRNLFNNPTVFCCDIFDIKDCENKIKEMTSATSPTENSLEDLLVIRVAMDWEDV